MLSQMPQYTVSFSFDVPFFANLSFPQVISIKIDSFIPFTKIIELSASPCGYSDSETTPVISGPTFRWIRGLVVSWRDSVVSGNTNDFPLSETIFSSSPKTST